MLNILDKPTMNNHNASSKVWFGIIFVVCLLLSAAIIIPSINIQKAIAFQEATAITRIYSPTISQAPLYIELDKITNRKAVVVNGTTTTATNATEVSFSGNGTARGVNYTDSGKGLIIPREDRVIFVKGYVIMITSSGDTTSASFQEIGHPMVDANNTIIINARGAAFFDSKATGKLAFLGNSVAIYKDIIYNNGTDKVIGWEWK
jgi:hypothetical protein